MPRQTKRTRRDSGTGSIYRDGNGYRVQIQIGQDPKTGNPIYKKVRAQSHAEAVEALSRLQHDHRQGNISHAKSLTVEDYANNHWLKQIERVRAPKTHQQYSWVLTKHVLPTLGRRKLDKVQRSDVQALVSALSTQNAEQRKLPKTIAREMRRAQKKGELPPQPLPPKLLGRRTLQSAVAVLHALFQDAIRDGLASSNPCKYIELPKETKRPPQFLTGEQIERLNMALDGSPVRELIRFMMATGVRAGEARGIRWQDIDFGRLTVRIAGQLQTIHGRLTYRPTTKTNQDRLLCIPEWVADELKELRSKQLLNEYSDPEGIAFLNPYGRRMQEKFVWVELRAACLRAGIQPVSPHKLRHTAATIALMETGDLHAVQKLLGHQQSRLTSDLYGHATAERLRPVSDALGRIVGRRAEES